jgi:hypothetical protein
MSAVSASLPCALSYGFSNIFDGMPYDILQFHSTIIFFYLNQEAEIENKCRQLHNVASNGTHVHTHVYVAYVLFIFQHFYSYISTLFEKTCCKLCT